MDITIIEQAPVLGWETNVHHGWEWQKRANVRKI